MRNSDTHSGKDLAKEIARLQARLEELSDNAKTAGSDLVDRGEEVLRIPCARPAS